MRAPTTMPWAMVTMACACLSACGSSATSPPEASEDAATSEAGHDAAAPTPSDAGATDAAKPIDAGATIAAGSSVTGTVTYSGTKTGTLRFGVFSSWPPSGPPAGTLSIPKATFPQSYTITDVAPGKYTLLVYLDLTGTDLMGPGTNDLQSAPLDVTVTATAPTTMDVTLVDK